MQSNIIINNLSIGYKKDRNLKIVLENINLSAIQGCMISLIGRNGEGKSTLLKTMAGLLPSVKGSISIDGRDLQEISRFEKSKLISFVGTANEINKTLKVKDFVALGRFPHTNIFGTLRDEDIEIIHQAMNDTNILHLAEFQTGEISDGELQRSQIARSLAQNTPIILLDEPMAFLDISNKFEMIGLMQRLTRDRNKTIIFSSHDLSIILGTADTIWFISNRKIIDAVPKDLIKNGKLNAFFDNTQVNFDIIKNQLLNFISNI